MKQEEEKLKEKWNDGKYVKKALEEGFSLRHASDELKKNKELVLYALSINNDFFVYIDPELKKDKEVVLKAFSKNPSATIFEHIPSDFLIDKKLAITLFEKLDEYGVQAFVCEMQKFLRLSEIKTGKKIKSFFDDEEICQAILEKVPVARFYFPTLSTIKHKKAILEIIQEENYSYVNKLPSWAKKDKEIVQALFDKLSSTYISSTYISSTHINGIMTNINLALIEDKNLLTNELADKIIKYSNFLFLHSFSNEYGKENDFFRYLFLGILDKDAQTFKVLPAWCKKDHKIVTKALQKKLSTIEYVDNKLKEDKKFLTQELALKIVNDDGKLLAHLLEWCKKDKKIVAAALKNTLLAIEYADPSIKEDEKLFTRDNALELIRTRGRYDGNILRNFPEWCKKDKKIVTEALDSSVQAIKYIDPSIMGDKEFFTQERALEIVKKNCTLWRHLPEWCKKNKEIIHCIRESQIRYSRVERRLDSKMLADWYEEDGKSLVNAIKKMPDTIQYIPDMLKKDKNFLTQELALEIVDTDGELLGQLPKWCQKDKKIVAAALKNKLLAIKYVDPSIKEDQELFTKENAVSVLGMKYFHYGTIYARFKMLPEWCQENPDIIGEIGVTPPPELKKLDIRKEIKIWISRNEEDPLGSLNKHRIFKWLHENKNTGRQLILISHAFSDTQKDVLEKFCKEYDEIRLVLLDEIEECVKKRNDPIASNLFEIAKAEITDKNGNFAAASDILRLLAIFLGFGNIYTDFDSSLHINSKDSSTLNIRDALFNVSASIHYSTNQRTGNDLYVFPGDQSKESHSLLPALMESILDNYLLQKGEGSWSDFFKERASFVKDSVFQTSGPPVLTREIATYVNQYYGSSGEFNTPVSIQNNDYGLTLKSGQDGSWLPVGQKKMGDINKEFEKGATIMQSHIRGFFARKNKSNNNLEKEVVRLEGLKNKN